MEAEEEETAEMSTQLATLRLLVAAVHPANNNSNLNHNRIRNLTGCGSLKTACSE